MYAQALGADSSGNFDLIGEGAMQASQLGGRPAVLFGADGKLSSFTDARGNDFFDRLTNFTLAFRACVPQTGTAVLLNAGSGSFRIEAEETTLRVFGQGEDYIQAELPAQADWFHVTVSRNADRGTLAVYVNGVKQAERAMQVSVGSDDHAFAIGSENVAIADLRLYDAALGLAAAAALYEGETEVYGLYNDTIESVGQIDTSAVNTVVSSTNPLSSVYAALPQTVSVQTAGGQTVTAAIWWYKTVDGDAYGLVYGGGAATTEKVSFLVSLSYSAKVNIANLGSVTITGADGVSADYASGEAVSSEYGAEYRLEVHVPLDMEIAAVRLGSVELQPDADGVYTFAFNGEDINVVLRAAEEICTIVFDTQGGSEVTSVQTAAGAYLDGLGVEAPVREGYTFAGWYSDRACTNEWGRNTPFTQDTTLYAKWIPVVEDVPEPAPVAEYVLGGVLAVLVLIGVGTGVALFLQHRKKKD